MAGLARHWILIGCAALLLCGCTGSGKEELLSEGLKHYEQKNYRGSIVLFRNALEKDPGFYRARFFLADAYMQEGRTETAEREFRKVALQAPDYPGLWLKLADLYNQANRPQEALAEAGKHLQRHPDDPHAWRLMGASSVLQGDLEEAQKRFRRALELDPQDIEAQLALADCLTRSDQNEEAIGLLQRIVSRDERHLRAQLDLARLENARGNREQALQIYRRVTEIDPGNAHAFYLMGLLLLENNDLDGAEALAGKLSRRFPDLPRGSQLQGFVCFMRRQFEEAAVHLQKTAETQPDLLTFYMLGMTYYHLGKLELAINQFQRFLDYRPEAVNPRVVLATILLRQKRVDDAITELKRALQLDSGHPQAHNALGNAYLAKGLFDEAAVEFDQSIRLAPRLVAPRLSKGMSSLVRGDFTEGEAALVEAVALAPETTDIRLFLVGHYLREKKFTEAVAALKQGMTGEPSDALLYNYMAAAHFGQEKPEAAIDCLEKAKRLKPDYFIPYYNLAAYFLTRGDYPRAEKEYKAVLKQRPDDLKALVALGQTAQLAGRDAEAEDYFGRAGKTGQLPGVLGWAENLHRRGRSAEALEVLAEAALQRPDNPQIPELQGKILAAQGRFAEALAAYARCEKIAPGRGLPLLVEAYLAQGQPAKAETVSRQMIDRNPEHPAGYLALSLVMEKQGRAVEAVRLLQELGGKAGGSAPVRMRQAELEERGGRLEQALAIYQRLVRETPAFYPALFAAGSVCERLGRQPDAIDYYRQTLALKDDFAPALNNLAYLYAANANRRQEALDLALRAYRAQPGNPGILDTLGLAYLQNDRPEPARQVLEQAAALLPEVATVKYHLGLAYHRLEEKEKSVQALLSALDLGAFPEAVEAKTLLAKITGKPDGAL